MRMPGGWPRSRWMLAIGALLILAALGVGVRHATDSSVRTARERYRAIKPRMTIVEVRRALEGMGDVLYSNLDTSEMLQDFDGRFLIAVAYQPASGGPPSPADAAGPPTPRADWVVKEKIFVERGRTGWFDDLLVGLGLKSGRFVDRERLTR